MSAELFGRLEGGEQSSNILTEDFRWKKVLWPHMMRVSAFITLDQLHVTCNVLLLQEKLRLTHWRIFASILKLQNKSLGLYETLTAAKPVRFIDTIIVFLGMLGAILEMRLA